MNPSRAVRCIALAIYRDNNVSLRRYNYHKNAWLTQLVERQSAVREVDC